MTSPLALPHLLQFQRWLELRAANPDELDTVLSWLHSAYDWVRRGEPLP